jgi:predicted MPP superfamily phosphohydrolase
MKVIVIGDIHGRDIWKEIVNQDYDLVVFIGDYLDSYDISIDKQITNFQEILDYKKANSDKVILLLGNHDFHYLPYIEDQYSGYKRQTKSLASHLLQSHIKSGDIVMSITISNYLFSHAGVSDVWLKRLEHYEENCDISTLINDYLIYKPSVFNFTMGMNFDECGDDICQTPIWIRPQSLLQSAVPGFIQVVGHTFAENIRYYGDNLIVVDSLPNYLILEI